MRLSKWGRCKQPSSKSLGQLVSVGPPFLWDKLRVNDADTDSTRAASTGANLALIAASLHCCHPSSSSSSAGVACCPDKGQAKVLRALDAI